MRALASHRIRSFVACAAVFCASCATSPTQLIVVVDTDLQIPAELDDVSVTVSSDTGVMEDEHEPLASAAGLPLTIGVIPSGDFLGPIDVVARGSHDGSVVVTRRARVTLVRGESLMLRLHLVARCVGVTCEAGESCGESGCEPVVIDELPRWPGSPPRLGADAGMLDAGPRDATVTDATVTDATITDATVRDATASDATMPDASSACDDVSDCDDAVPCTIDSCSAAGLCVHAPDDSACDDAEPCTGNRCDPAAGCVFDPSADGTACGMGSCESYGACSYADTCAESGVESRTCTDLTCGSGTCRATMRSETRPCTRDTDGMMCASTMCGGYGACDYASTCDENATQTRTCDDYRCGSGSCVPSARSEGQACTRDTDGASCGSGVVCRTGSCVSCAPTLSGSHGIVGTSYMTRATGSGSSLTFTDGSSGTPMGSITAAGATFSGSATMPICIWQVQGMGNRIRFVDWDGTTAMDVMVSGATVSGAAGPPCTPGPYGCFPPCLARVVGSGSSLQLTFGDSSTGTLSFGCP